MILVRSYRLTVARIEWIFFNPFVVLAIFVVAQWVAVYAGDLLRKKMRPVEEEERTDFDIIRGAALTLLGLIIGFSIAMAVTRYDQHKNFEEAEANAIGSEYVRVDFLPAEDAARARELLRRYVDQRVAFYLARDEGQVHETNTDAEKLHADLWSVVRSRQL
jgi:hypothetical protein